MTVSTGSSGGDSSALEGTIRSLREAIDGLQKVAASFGEALKQAGAKAGQQAAAKKDGSSWQRLQEDYQAAAGSSISGGSALVAAWVQAQLGATAKEHQDMVKAIGDGFGQAAAKLTDMVLTGGAWALGLNPPDDGKSGKGAANASGKGKAGASKGAADQKDQANIWANAWKQAETAVGKSVTAMVTGTQTVRQAMHSMATAVLTDFTQMAAKTAEAWIASQLRITVETLASQQFRNASETAAEHQALADHAASALKHIEIDVQRTYAGVFGFLAPSMGPFAAIPAAAAAALVGAAEIAIPSAAGGYDVPADTLAMIHKNEVVLPAPLADRFRAGADAVNGGGAGGGFSPTIHFSANSRLTAAELADHADTLVAVLRRAHRNGAFAGARQ